MAGLSRPKKRHFIASSAKLTFFPGPKCISPGTCEAPEENRKTDLGGKLGRKAVTTPSLIITSFLVTALPDPQVSTNLFMTCLKKGPEFAMHLKLAGIYTGTKRHPGKRPGVHVPSPEGQACRSHQLQEPSEKQPAHLPTRQSWQWHMQLSICLSPAAHTSLQPSPDSTRQHTGSGGPPGNILISHTHCPAIAPGSLLKFISRNLGSN